ncbi:2OG-Fe(II) oxygenase [Microbulbifer halophilus]|uniref:2OG-Fe(II) oxygenase n=1 Tax=Microbulbifer halophilus TaxID=453963 RepID=A0ABW5ECM4_9GAMM|nr:2OG-Fe(II) oxygenase [Microbulbifer halophilus]MCW8126953.1 2OG-Fe(II) oxygenase [Microbulbifer halophilus]
MSEPMESVVTTAPPDVAERVEAVNWARVTAELDARGCATIENLLTDDECRSIAGLYSERSAFRSRVVMSSHGFGSGEYQYFDYPQPGLVAGLRTAIYPYLVSIANRWHESMRFDTRFPATHAEYLERCHNAGQRRATPLLLSYGPGDYNCLHQDLYGDHVFPLQLAVLLSEPGRDFAGGEFVMTEQRPRRQSRAEVVPLRRGDAVVFAVRHRPVRGKRGCYRVNLRHGVSRVRSGQRRALGVIFHDAS